MLGSLALVKYYKENELKRRTYFFAVCTFELPFQPSMLLWLLALPEK